ncbi:MAG: ArsR family transcriptional regulator [Desulfobacterales bacterium SG8_35]|nr:MAG: ArsR family transcriptional regulator [Desulfobacterales bacterium SG8_35]
MKEFIQVMKALSDRSRVKVMKMLEKKELCVCEITAILALAQPTVSKHLKVLEEAGLVESRKDGPWVNYRLVQEHESPYGSAMQKHLADWLTEDGEIRMVLEQVETINREKICAA